MTNNEVLERKIVDLIAADRLFIAASSIDGKLKRARTQLADKVELCEDGDSFDGKRAYAYVEAEDTMKARGMKDGIAAFCEAHPEHKAEVYGFIEGERRKREVTLYFGLAKGAKLNALDYLGVMQNLDFTDYAAKRIYPQLLETSRKLSKARDEERSILIG